MEKIYRFNKIISSYGKMRRYPQTLRFQIIEKHIDFIKLKKCARTPKCYTTHYDYPLISKVQYTLEFYETQTFS